MADLDDYVASEWGEYMCYTHKINPSCYKVIDLAGNEKYYVDFKRCKSKEEFDRLMKLKAFW